MAPEMLNKEPYDPVQADIWSIGVILYEMLIGNFFSFASFFLLEKFYCALFLENFNYFILSD